MKKEEFYFLSANEKTKIHGIKWLPDHKVKAILQITHGVTEHILRYEELAKYFTERKIAIVGIDLLGHGKSISKDMEPMYFGPKGSWNLVVKDIETCRNVIQKELPNIPYYLLGFSLGSFLARSYVIQYDNSIDGLILLGTGQTPILQIEIAKLLTNIEAKKANDDKTTPLIKKLTFDTYNQKFKPNKTDLDWLCSNEKSLNEYLNDPLRGEAFTIGLFRELLNGMKFTSKKQNIQQMNKETPILLLSGKEDPVGEFGKGVQRVKNAFQAVGIKDVTIKLYPKLRHDILHEEPKENIYKDIYDWIEEKLK